MQADLCIVLIDLIVFKPLCQRNRRETGGFCQLGVTRFPEMTLDIGFGDAELTVCSCRCSWFVISNRDLRFDHVVISLHASIGGVEKPCCR